MGEAHPMLPVDLSGSIQKISFKFCNALNLDLPTVMDLYEKNVITVHEKDELGTITVPFDRASKLLTCMRADRDKLTQSLPIFRSHKQNVAAKLLSGALEQDTTTEPQNTEIESQRASTESARPINGVGSTVKRSCAVFISSMVILVLVIELSLPYETLRGYNEWTNSGTSPEDSTTKSPSMAALPFCQPLTIDSPEKWEDHQHHELCYYQLTIIVDHPSLWFNWTPSNADLIRTVNLTRLVGHRILEHVLQVLPQIQEMSIHPSTSSCSNEVKKNIRGTSSNLTHSNLKSLTINANTTAYNCANILQVFSRFEFKKLTVLNFENLLLVSQNQEPFELFLSKHQQQIEKLRCHNCTFAPDLGTFSGIRLTALEYLEVDFRQPSLQSSKNVYDQISKISKKVLEATSNVVCSPEESGKYRRRWKKLGNRNVCDEVTN